MAETPGMNGVYGQAATPPAPASNASLYGTPVAGTSAYGTPVAGPSTASPNASYATPTMNGINPAYAAGARASGAASLSAAPSSAPYASPQAASAVVMQEREILYPGATYPMTEQDHTLRLIAFILDIVSCIAGIGLYLIPLIWMIPTTVIAWGVYKGTRTCSTAFAVVELIFTNVISGILHLCSKHE